MNRRTLCIALILLIAAPARARQDGAEAFDGAASTVHRQLEESLAELADLRERIAAETLPLSRRLRDLEAELVEVRRDYQNTSRTLDGRLLDLNNLRQEIESRREEATYLSNLFGEYVRNFESRLHIAELQRYEADLEAARLAPENTALEPAEVYAIQAGVLGLSLDRLQDALGGARFDGTAVNEDGLVDDGTFVLVGPAALFRTADGTGVGTVEQRLGSLEPAMVPFADPVMTAAADSFVRTGRGELPFDPTLGNAHRVEETHETFVEHVRKGGPVMIPIFALAGLAFLVALFKWLHLFFVRKPSQRRIRALLEAVARRDRDEALRRARAVGGPAGRMLVAGVEHVDEPRELIEEIMYEQVLTTRLRLQRFLPFIAICAASAPLLGLLGTVTGIINTFKLITVFGSGDVKMLSGGISEALITTEFGLIVAIPSLLLHAYLSRKARGIVDRMEKGAIALLNQIGKTYRAAEPVAAPSPAPRPAPESTAAPVAAATRPTDEQVKDALAELLSPMVSRRIGDVDRDAPADAPARDGRRVEVVTAGSGRTATVEGRP